MALHFRSRAENLIDPSDFVMCPHGWEVTSTSDVN